MKQLTTLIFIIFCSLFSHAQTFPNLVATDISGVEHNLQADYLDQGIPVLVHFFATWNQWDAYFMEFNSMQTAFSDFGPSGSDQIMMIAFEIDEMTSDFDVSNQTNISLFDWTQVINYPIFNLDDPSWGTIQMGAFAMPSLALICPDGQVYTDGTVSNPTFPFNIEEDMTYGNFLTVEGVVNGFEQFCGNLIADENVSGTVTLNTQNCVQDLNNPLKNTIVTFDNQGVLEMRSTDKNGYYEAFLDNGTYEISFEYNSSMMSVCFGPGPVTVNDDTTPGLDAYYEVDIFCPEIQLSLNPWLLRPCDLISHMQAEICNTGTVDLSVFSLDLIFPAGSDLLYINSNEPYTYDMSTGQFSMVCDSLEIFTCKELLFAFHTPCGVELGDSLCFEIISNPIQINPDCSQYIQNELEICNEVIGAYDPNDKTGMTPSIGPDHYISAGTELEYMIRFQNTGNDTAFTVRIEDQLSELFDASTIRPLSSSHNFEMSFSEGKLEFLFPNILLVDSFKNEMLSHGFITFKVKLRDDLLPGTKISNSASIFFDSNAPVVTNTYDYNIPLPISTNFTSENVFSIYPNPTSDKVNIKLDWAVEGGTVYLYDLKGKLLKQNEFVGTSFIFPIEEINIGLYLIKIKDHNGNSSIQKIVKE